MDKRKKHSEISELLLINPFLGQEGFNINVNYNNFGPLVFESTTPFFHDELLEQILQIIRENKKFRILIHGAPGSGKTTLLQMLISKMSSRNHPEYPVEHTYTLLPQSYELLFAEEISEEKRFFVVDGLDELPIRNTNENLSTICVKTRPLETQYANLTPRNFLNDYRDKNVICTSRDLSEAEFFDFVLEMPFASVPLLSKLFMSMDENALKNYNYNYRRYFHEIVSKLDADTAKQFYEKFSYQRYEHSIGLDYCPSILLPNRTLSAPSEELTASLQDLNASLFERIKTDVSFIEKLSPRQFEEVVCEMLDKHGMRVILTKKTRDGGKDIIVCENRLLGNFVTYVECKKYHKDRPVQVGLVRELYGVVEADRVSMGLLVTTSYFTKGAKDFTEQVKHRMSLMDYNGLLAELTKAD